MCHKYVGIHIVNRLDWNDNRNGLCRNGQGRRLCWWRLKLNQNVAACVLLSDVFWGRNIKRKEAARLIRRSVLSKGEGW